jgi:dephospho-CoA kinase
MFTIGVTGPSGAGKSLFCSLFANMGFFAIDCDEVYHELTDAPSDCTRELASEFGDEILLPSGALDRRALANVVFAPDAKAKLDSLNAITHKYVLCEVRRRIAALPTEYRGALVDAPLLFESGFDKECDLTVALLAPRETRLSRLSERDGLPTGALNARLDAAKSDEWYIERCDVTVYNTGDTAELQRAVAEIAAKITNT